MRILLIIFILAVCYKLSPAQDVLSNSFTADSNPISINDNTPDTLYRGHNYEYYQKLYKRSSTNQIVSLVMIPAGAGLGVWGVYRMRDSLREEDYSEDFKAFRGGLGILVAGTIVCTVGIIFAIKSGKDKSKSKEAMEELKRDMALSFAISNDGLGLVLRF